MQITIKLSGCKKTDINLRPNNKNLYKMLKDWTEGMANRALQQYTMKQQC